MKIKRTYIHRGILSLFALLSLAIVTDFFLSDSPIFSDLGSPRVNAATVTWDGGGDGASWNDADNWSTNTVPTTGDDVIIDSSTTVYLPSEQLKDLFLHVKMDDNAASTTVTDSFGTKDGTSIQNTSIMTTTGKLNGAFSFNGTSDYIDYNDLNSTSESVISISAWIMFDDLTGHQPIYTDGGSTKGIEFGLYNDTLQVAIQNNGTTRGLTYDTTGLSTGTWTHVVAVVDGPNGDLFIYVDGTLVASDTALSAFTDFNGTDGVNIGNTGNNSPATGSFVGALTYLFDGTMDDLRVYKNVLLQKDVDVLYNSASGVEQSLAGPVNKTIQSLTVGDAGGLSTPTLVFAFDAEGSTNNLDISGGNLIVHPSATVTHSVGAEGDIGGRIDIDVTSGSATITGTIDADKKGYLEGTGPGASSDPNAYKGAGGSYGGVGGEALESTAQPGDIYGSITDPRDLGSGGDGYSSAISTGGGSIILSASGTITIDGIISADGADVTNNQAGGSAGGSVNITAGTIAGTGSISVDGGNGGGGNTHPGGGGGGRIALTYDTLSLSTSNLSAFGGESIDNYAAAPGGAGTIYLKDNAVSNGDLIIDNNGVEQEIFGDDRFVGRTPLTPVGTILSLALDDLIISNKGNLDLNSDTTITYNTLDWSTEGIVTDNGGSMTLVNASASVTIPATAALYANTTRSWTDLTVNGTLTHSNNTTTAAGQLYDIDITTTGNITVNVGGAINADYRGYENGEGPGAGQVPDSYQGAGGSHGGIGGIGGEFTSYPSDVYGSITAPVTVGSGGDNYAVSTVISLAGGAIHLTSGGTILVDGSITANGYDVTSNHVGGSSGGSVYLDGATISGSATVEANGGDGGGSSHPGAGGGGRVALYYDTLSLSTANIQAYGGASNSPYAISIGGAGTVYLKDNAATNGDLIIDNGDIEQEEFNDDRFIGRTPLTPEGTSLSLTVDELIIQNKGNLDLTSDTTLTYNTLTWNDDGIVTDNGGSMPLINASASVTIPETSVLYANTTRSWSDLTVNGTLTHSNNTTTAAGQLYDIDITTTGDITINATGEVDADWRGYEISEGPGAGADVYGGGGASHGGVGGYGQDNFSGFPGEVYGSISAPVTIGSGGSSYTPQVANGGGAVKLTSPGTITVNGTITADATNVPENHGGAGSGGSVYLDASTVTGSGTITATGGNSNGNTHPGAGGGGRIAIYYDTLSLPDANIFANGGDNSTTYVSSPGGAGTIYLKDNAVTYPDLIIDNEDIEQVNFNDDQMVGRTKLTPDSTPLSLTVDDLIIRNKGNLELTSDTTLTYSTLTWNDDGIVTDNGGTMALINNTASVTIPVGATLYANTTHSWTDLTVNGTLTHSNNNTTANGKLYGIDITTSGDITISGTGIIDADWRGYQYSNGPGAGSSNYGGGGASHGGVGAIGDDYDGLPGEVYGSITAPITLGSGGGSYNNTRVMGGGSVRLTAISGTVTVNGEITADAYDVAQNNSGGGSGGSIYIDASIVAGLGSISANGGRSSSGGTYAGAGGGGRVAVYYDTLSLSTQSIAAYGGESERTDQELLGGSGTVYLKDNANTYGDLILDNNNHTFLNNQNEWVGYAKLTPDATPLSITFDEIIIRDKGNLDLSSDTTIAYTTLTWTSGVITDNGGTMVGMTSGDLVVPVDGVFLANTARTYTTITNNGIISHRKNIDSEAYTIDLTTTGDVVIASGAAIDVDGTGYRGSYGTGTGSDAGDWGTGAGHGGVGGVSDDVGSVGGSTYDSETMPVNIGSGGGNDGGFAGGTGGGAVKLTVGGGLTLNGNITANAANDAYLDAGGGSGGAIWLVITGSLLGGGDLTANGGDAQESRAGAGSGGRIRYECGSGSWSGTASVDSGSIGHAASAGTISFDCSFANPPAVDTVRIGSTANGTNISPLTLTAGTTTSYYVNGQISDDDGFADVEDVDVVFYRSSVTNGSNCTADPNDCYIQTSCTLSNGSGTTIDYSCQVSIDYYADPTDAGSAYEADTWNVYVLADDGADTGFDNSYMNEVSTLQAISFPNVAHGALNPAVTQSNTLVQPMNVGNVDVDFNISMANPISCSTGSIPISNNEFDLNTCTYGACTYTLSATPQSIPVNLPQRTLAEVTDDLYWAIEVPSTGVLGVCTGDLTVNVE